MHCVQIYDTMVTHCVVCKYAIINHLAKCLTYKYDDEDQTHNHVI